GRLSPPGRPAPGQRAGTAAAPGGCRTPAPPGPGNADEPAGSTAGQPETTTAGTLAPKHRNPAAAGTARHSGQFQLEPAGCLFIAGPRAGRQPQRLERALFPPCKKPVGVCPQ